ncbi:MAG: hypothetical protein FJ147_11410 [Deltaproteobacteria bacterium]|nr:hypothetical protein [Deltaproteobacteria bacterium]
MGDEVWNSIDRFLERYGSLVLVMAMLVGGLTIYPLVFGEKTRSGAAARECLPGDSETWIPAEGLTCVSARPPALTGSFEEDFVSYQVPQEKISEHVDLWQRFAQGAERSRRCGHGLLTNSPRAWPHVEKLEVVTALPPNMDEGCVWVMRETGWFYIQVRWGH